MSDEMSGEEITTWGLFETRSIVRDPIELNTHCVDPELAEEMKSYTWGQFETRSIVCEPIEVQVRAVKPCLRMTIGLNEDAKLSHDDALDYAAKIVAAVIELAPRLQLRYSKDQSFVEDGKLIAKLVPQTITDDTDEQLHALLTRLRSWEFREEPRPMATQPRIIKPVFAHDCVPIGA